MISKFTEANGLRHSNAKKLVPMGYLTSRIVEDILAEQLSVDLTARYLNHMTKLMLCWSGQLALVDKAHLCKMTLYVRGAGMSLARIEVDTVALTYTRTYLHPDQLGSATAGTSQSGAVLWREQYAPYGDKLTAPAANDDLGSFTGHIDDDATTDMNLTYMQARYYDPGAGRFTSIDPVTFLDTMEPGMVNRYAYTMGDPVNMVDPDGGLPQVIAAIGSAAAVGAVIGVGVEAYSIHKSGGDPLDFKTNRAAYGKAAAIGGIGGAVGGAAAIGGSTLAVATSHTLTKLGARGGGLVGSISNGAVGGGAGSASAETTNQILTHGGIVDGNAIGTAAFAGAATGALVGGVRSSTQTAVNTSGTIQPTAANLSGSQGSGLRGPFPGSPQTGSTIGSAAGVATAATIEVAREGDELE